MTRDEFAEIAALLQRTWHQTKVPVKAWDSYASELSDLDADAVRAAVLSLSREGRDFMPLAGQIRSRVAHLALDPPQFAEVKRSLSRMVAAGMGGPYAANSGTKEAIQSRVAAAHPAVRGFVVTVGAGEIRRSIDEGGSGDARLRKRWEDYLRDTAMQAALRGLDAPSLPAVERANGGPRRLDMAALVERAADEPSAA